MTGLIDNTITTDRVHNCLLFIFNSYTAHQIIHLLINACTIYTANPIHTFTIYTVQSKIHNFHKIHKYVDLWTMNAWVIDNTIATTDQVHFTCLQQVLFQSASLLI